MAALREHRLVALVGLPGIGKTELGREVARQAQAHRLCRRVIYQDIQPGHTTGLLRSQLSTALGHPQAAEDNRALAALFQAKREPVLLVLDNTEDLLKTDEAEAAYEDQVNVLLAHTDNLRLLLTTRCWLLAGTDPAAQPLEVPPLERTRAVPAALLAAELQQMGVLRPA